MHNLIENDVTSLAREAVRQFRAMMPMLNAYVQVMTGNKKARVIMTTEAPRTDGVNIWLRPPTDLGKKAVHSRTLCDKRDKVTGLQRCPACAQREGVLVNLFHEIAHIVYESMVPATEGDKVQFLKQAAQVGNIEAIQRRLSKLGPMDQYRWLGLANAVSPYFQLLLNALEDVRVNQRMFQARRGTQPMYIADEMKILREGLEHYDPVKEENVRTRYSDTPLDSQAIIGIYLIGMGVYDEQYLDPLVAAAMKDKQLNYLAEDIRTVKSAQGAVNLAFQVLVRLRELGFLLEPEERPEPEEELDDDEDDESGESGSNGDSSNQDEPDDTTPEQGDDDADETAEETGEGDGPGAGVPTDETTPEDDDSQAPQAEPGNTGGNPANSSDGSGPDAADAGSGSEAPGGQGDPGDDGQAEESDGSSGGSDGDDDGQSGGRDTRLDGDDGQDSSDGGSVPPGPLGAYAGTGRGADRTIEGGGDDAANDDGELSDDLDRSDGHEGSNEPDTDGNSPGPNRDSHSTSESRDGERDGAEAPEARDGDSNKGSSDGSEGADSEGAPEAQATASSRPDYGTPEDAAEALEQILGHRKQSDAEAELDGNVEDELGEAISIAISQSEHFDAPGENVAGIEFATYRDGWRKPGRPNQRLRRDEDDTIEAFMPSEGVLGPPLLRMRRAFQDNARGGKMPNLKSGKIDNRTLGKRAWSGDERLFKQPIRVAKKDYFVVIGLDISGSTAGPEIDLIKRAGMAQAEMLNRLKIPFAVYAHTGGWRDGDDFGFGGGMLDAFIFPVKEAHQPWDTAAKQRLAELRSQSVNLDGHTIEYYRKRLDEKVVRKETEGILMYYTDGAMPLTNFDEELEILKREIAICKYKGYTEMAVGIGTDSPIEHGFDTVVIHGDQDLVKVVDHLARRLLR